MLDVRVGQSRLVLGIISKIFAPTAGVQRCEENADYAGRPGDCKYLQNRYANIIAGGHGDKCDYRSRYGRAGYAHLGCNGRYRHGPLGPDTVFQRDVGNDRHQCVDHVSGAAENGQKKSAVRCQEGYPRGMLAQEALGDLDEKIHPTSGLQDARRGDGGDDNVYNRGGG